MKDEVSVVAVVVKRDDGDWYVCPLGGEDCCRVHSAMGEWAADAIDWHVSNHHQRWR